MNSPLGKYSQIVAAVSAIGIIGAYIIAALLNDDTATGTLHDAAFLALGAVFSAAAVTNGWKQVVTQQSEQANAIHARLDALGAPAAAQLQSLKGE